MKKEVIFILGLPGSGKSTLVRKLSLELGANVVSSKSVFKNISKREKANLQKKYVSKGLEIPDNKYVNLIKKYITDSSDTLFLIEGFPYNLKQLNMSESLFCKENIQLRKVIYINIEVDFLLIRIKERRICPDCNNSYRNIAICPECNTATVTRVDDSDNILNQRIKFQSKYIKKIVKYYNGNNALIEIEATQSEEEKISTIMKQL